MRTSSTRIFTFFAFTLFVLATSVLLHSPGATAKPPEGKGGGNGGGNGGGGDGGNGNLPSFVVVDLGGPAAWAGAVNDQDES